MPSTHRTYDKDFRQEAVNLLLSSGRPLKRVAAELGVTAKASSKLEAPAIHCFGVPTPRRVRINRLRLKQAAAICSV